jgi:heme/copper-type cytochrome/quinol oxidase subunit 4
LTDHESMFEDRTPGVEEHEPTASYLSYTVGLGLAILATIASFIVSQTNLLWPPGIPAGLIVLALAQIGVHLVFFLHLPRQHEQYSGSRLWRADRLSHHHRLGLDHRQSQQQYDADAAISGDGPI